MKIRPRNIYFATILIISGFISFCGCTALKEAGLYATDVATTPVALLDPNLYQSKWPDVYDKARNAPPEEWEVIKVGKWKQDKYDKKRGEECRSIRKRHTPTGIIDDTYECRPKAQGI